MKKSILLIIFLAAITFTFANGIVPPKTAQSVAKNFINESFTAEYQAMPLQLQFTQQDQNGDAIYYCFQIGDNASILISAVESVTPVLGFSLHNKIIQNDPYDYFLQKYSEVIPVVKTKGLKATTKIASDWKHYTAQQFVPCSSPKYENAVEPLITTKWSQGDYYNNQCPYYHNPDQASASGTNRCVVGCVALNMINFMYYYRFPTTGAYGVSYISTHTEKDADGNDTITFQSDRITVNFGQQHYSYDNMVSHELGSLKKHLGDFQKLVFHAGVSNLMSYSIPASGSVSENAMYAMQEYWKFSTHSTFINKDDAVNLEDDDPANDTCVSIISDSLWTKIYLIPELKAMHPLFYSGRGHLQSSSGHAWILDGYYVQNNVPYFHVNMGWGGIEGFRVLGNFYDLSNFESIISGLQPDSADVVKPTTGNIVNNATTGSFSDGAGNVKYQPNTYRTWLIAPDKASRIRIIPRKIKTEENADIIKIYKGGSANGTLLATYSGNYVMEFAQGINAFSGKRLPVQTDYDADSLFVVFTSDTNDVTDYGFVFDYVTLAFTEDGCASRQILNEQYHYWLIDKPSPIVTSDADIDQIYSADEPYRADNTCSWEIQPNYVTGYAITFRKFDLRGGDFIDIYDNSNKASNYTSYGHVKVPELLYRFDMNNIPYGIYNINNADKLKINFVSDNAYQGNGFELGYYAIVGINQYSDLENVTLYPNPTNNYVNIDITSDKNQNIDLQIVDMTGKVIYRENIDHTAGNQIYPVSVTGFAKGIYFLNLYTASGKTTQKLIVQ